MRLHPFLKYEARGITLYQEEHSESAMLAIDAKLPVKPDERERAIEIGILTLAKKSRAENGVIDYRVSIDVDDPNVLENPRAVRGQEGIRCPFTS